jgi:hypothetical protein
MSEFQPMPEQPQDQTSHPIDSLGLKELLNMSLDEEAGDIQSAITVIEEVLLEPIPDPADSDARDEYNAKMNIVKQWAETQNDRADALLIRQRVEERISETY